MSRTNNSILVFFAVCLLVIAATSAMAQVDRQIPINDDVGRRVATLACCRCLGGSNSLDLSTISSNAWTVNGNPVAFLTSINGFWNLPTGPAKWVSTVGTGGTGGIAAGAYEYKLRFVVPACTIEQRVTLAGNYGGDDDVPGVFLDNITTSTSTQVASCSGGWCFNSTNNSNPRTFSTSVPPGTYDLRVKIQNGGGPSGMFINAKLTSTCRN
ncbi:MAG TPA: hypothetical protein VFI24_03760 [Pyrinomonadaceae bacterium]|nr:hypothetical protein [Pyrinomonadaceae bacterium]